MNPTITLSIPNQITLTLPDPYTLALSYTAFGVISYFIYQRTTTLEDPQEYHRSTELIMYVAMALVWPVAYAIYIRQLEDFVNDKGVLEFYNDYVKGDGYE